MPSDAGVSEGIAARHKHHKKALKALASPAALTRSLERQSSLALVPRNHLRNVLTCGVELHRQGIHAMARVFFGHAFTAKDVPQVPTAVLTENLDSSAIGIGFPTNRAGDFVIETRPAAT